MPRVSVIIPAFNRARLLKDAVQSVLDQTYQDFEIIVVDDGSTDNTRDVIGSFTDTRIRYLFQENQGVSVAYNNGISNALGEWIAFLDSDDLWLPEKLELQIKAIESSPQVALIYSDTSNFGIIDPSIPQTQFQRLKWPPPRGRVLDKLIECCFPQTSTLLIKRETLIQVGLYDVSMHHCEDYELLYRIARKHEFEVVNLPLSKFRLHGIQLSRDYELMLKGHIIFFKKALKADSGNKAISKKLRARLSGYYFQYGMVLLKQRQFKKGAKELINSAQTSIRVCNLSALSMMPRVLRYSFRALKPGRLA